MLLHLVFFFFLSLFLASNIYCPFYPPKGGTATIWLLLVLDTRVVAG